MYNLENQRRYELSLWTLQDSFITVLKPSGMKWDGQCIEPHLVIKDDGEQTLSFKIPMYLQKDGEFIENPIWHNVRNGVLMVNLRKIKIIFNKYTEDEAVFELIITKVTESHEGFKRYCEVEAEGLAFHELGKQGYKITLSGQDEVDLDFPTGNYKNNIDYWVKKVLKNSDWTYSVQMDWSNEDGVVDNLNKPYSKMSQKERNDLNNSRENNGLRRRDKIYEDDYISSWKYDSQTDNIIPIDKVEGKEKFRLVEASESNRYNLTQTIAEIFQVYCKYVYTYDENYHIVGREIVFYNNFIQEKEEILDFTYYYNTQSISREMDGADIVTKMYVKPLNDVDMPTGEATITETNANKSLEDYILNFDYLHLIGTIAKEQYDSIPDYEKEMRKINEELLQLEDEILELQLEIPTIKAKIATLNGDEESETIGTIQLAEQELSNATAFLNSITSSDGEDDGLITIDSNNPQLWIAIKNKKKYYIKISVEGLMANTLQLYLNKECNNNGKIGKNKYKIETDSNGNATKITGLAESTINPNNTNPNKICYATFSYSPRTQYENIITTYSARIMADQDKLNKLRIKLENYENDLETKQEKQKELLEKKEKQIAVFEKLMGTALREGMWQPEEDYIKFGDRYSEDLKLTSTSIIDKTKIASIGWSKTKEEYDEEYNYYENGIEQELQYYPCIDLRTQVTIGQTTQSILQWLSYRKSKNENYLNEFSYSFVALSEQNISQNDDKIAYRKFFMIGSGMEFAFLRGKKNAGDDKDKVIPVLMITDADTLVGLDENQQPVKISSYLKKKGKLGVIKIDADETGADLEIEQQIPIPSNSAWVTHPERYFRVYPRIQINNRYLKASDNNLAIVPKDTTEKLEENYDYYMLSNKDCYFITLKSHVIIEWGKFIWLNNGKIFNTNFTISNTPLAIYLDAIKVLKENSAPKVSYKIDPSILNEKFFYNAYNRLDQLAHINDFELKFENVMGYISEIDLDLDKPWDDKVTVKNYKTKFEDLFSRIVAETEEMRKNAHVVDLVVSAITPKGDIAPETFLRAIDNANVQVKLQNVISNTQSVIANKLATAAAANKEALMSTTVYNVMNGNTGLAFKGGNISEIQLNKQWGLVVQGTQTYIIDSSTNPVTTQTDNVFFRVDNNHMGFFKGVYSDAQESLADNDPKKWKSLLYFENGDLALSGNIYAKSGWFGGERGWIIGDGSIQGLQNFPAAIDDNNNKTITDFGGLFYSANGKMIFSNGNPNSSNPEENKPHIILYERGFDTDQQGHIIGPSSDPVFVFDGTNLSIKGAITATSGSFTGEIKARSGEIGTTNGNKITIGGINETNNNRAYIYSGVTNINDTTHDGFYLGTNGLTIGKGVFKVTNTGVLTAVSANITGTINASSGNIGGWTIGSNYIGSGQHRETSANGISYIANSQSSYYTFWSGNINSTIGGSITKGTYWFGVRNTGELEASNANISGTITATSGRIGGNASGSGWEISNDELQSSFTIGNKAAHMLIHTDDISITQETDLGTYSELKLSLNPYGIKMTANQSNETGFQHSIFSLHHIPASTATAILSMFGNDVISYSSVDNPIFYGNINNFNTKNLIINSSQELILQGSSIKIKIGNNTVKELEIDGNGFVKAIEK